MDDTEKNNLLPKVIVNMAMSADGKIATQNRAVHSFGSKKDVENLYRLRAMSDAVICGAETVKSENVTLGVGGEKFKKIRLKNGLNECHIRIIVSGSVSISPELAVFKSKISPIIILTTNSANPEKLETIKQTDSNLIHILKCGESEVDFKSAFRILKSKWNINTLLCEGGGRLNSALFRSGLVDELYITICPYIFGGSLAPTIADGEGIKRLEDCINLKLISKRILGNEIFLHYKINK